MTYWRSALSRASLTESRFTGGRQSDAKAREALADQAAYEIGLIAANCTPETAVADRVRLVALQWRASKLSSRKYSERRVNEVVGAEGGPLEVKAAHTIDCAALSHEQRDQLREILLAAKALGAEAG